MDTTRTRLLAVSAAFLLMLTGCAPETTTTAPEDASPDTSVTQEQAPSEEESAEPSGEASDITIPAGAYAASADFPFPVPEGWSILEPFVEGTLGKDVSMDGSVEYPGDAKEAAATYLEVLKAAGFDAYVYAPGELTNQASLAAEGSINGTQYTAIINFDVHADGYQRASITAVEED